MDIPYKFLNLHNTSSLVRMKKGTLAIGLEGEETQHLKGSSLWFKD
jgi:hypothetical protein